MGHSPRGLLPLSLRSLFGCCNHGIIRGFLLLGGEPRLRLHDCKTQFADNWFTLG